MAGEIIRTLSENTIRKLRDDHFKLMRMVRELTDKIEAIGGADDNGTVLYRNVGAEQVPQYGVMRIDDYDPQYRVHLVDIPLAAEPQQIYLVNGHCPTSPDSSGFGYGPHGDNETLYDPADGEPQVGETWGPTDDWKLRKSGSGFLITGGARTENGLSIVRATQVPEQQQTGMLVAALISSQVLERWDSDDGGFDVIGNVIPRTYTATPADGDSDIVIPSLDDVAIYELQTRDGELYYNYLENATIYNPTPWEYRAAGAGADDRWTLDSSHLLYVEKHNGLYIAKRGVNWTPHAHFKATAFDSTGSISGFKFDWYDNTIDEGNLVHGNIAERWQSGSDYGIKILASGWRKYRFDLVFDYLTTHGTTITDFSLVVTPNNSLGGSIQLRDKLTLSGGTTKISDRGGTLSGTWYCDLSQNLTYTPCTVTASFSTTAISSMNAILTVTPFGI